MILSRSKFLDVAECQVCGVEVSRENGEIWMDGMSYCHECARGRSYCSVCARPVFGAARQSARGSLCTTCADYYPHCDQCQNVINERCDRYKQNCFCVDCAEEFPLCLDCGELSPEYVLGRFGGTCSYCGGALRRCQKCYRLTGSSWRKFRGDWACTDCLPALSRRCQWCQAPFPATDHTACPDCRSELLTDPRLALELLADAKDFCRREFAMDVERQYHLLVADSQIERYVYCHNPYLLGHSWLGLWNNQTNSVWLRSEVPVWLASAVLVHEHVHVWQREHCPRQSADLREGLARWVERRAVLGLGKVHYADCLEGETCPIYGGGLRKLLELEATRGSQGMLRAVRRMRSFSVYSLWLGELFAQPWSPAQVGVSEIPKGA